MDEFLDKKTKTAIQRIILSYKKKRELAIEKLGLTEKEYKSEVTSIRRKVFEDFEGNLAIAKKSFKNNGFILHEVSDSKEAQIVLGKILKNAKFIAKSKTNTGKEVGLDEVLERFNFCETDLGDFIVQFFGEKDQHYVLPAIHISAKMIAEKINEKYKEKVKADPSDLTHYLSQKIREKILRADVGITGANFITKSGQVVLLENEGNISLVSRVPQKHIVICGVDKLTETTEDAVQLCKTAAVFGTGQDITQYISIISGPSKTADIENKLVEGAQGAKEVHLILVNNGRIKAIKSDFKDILRCINCGACINFCPVYHQLGRRYGGDYIGSKGIVASFLQENLKESFDKGSFKCTLCAGCFENCPMKINLSSMIRKIRELQNNNSLQTKSNKEMLSKVKKYGNPFGEVTDNKKDIPDELYCC